MRLVARGCFQDDEELDTDTVFASAPSLVTLRLMLALAVARGWFISLADISTAFLRVALLEDVFLFPPKEYYPSGNCLWKLNRAMYGVKQSPQLWQSHFAAVMKTLGFRRCKSDSNLYCHPSKELYILAYVDDLLIIGDAQKTKDFVDPLSKELLVKITGNLSQALSIRSLEENCVTTLSSRLPVTCPQVMADRQPRLDSADFQRPTHQPCVQLGCWMLFFASAAVLLLLMLLLRGMQASRAAPARMPDFLVLH